MKKIITATLTILLISGIVQSCKKSDFNINKNPNSPTDSTVTYNVLLASAQQSTSAIIASDWGWLQNWMGYWARSGSYAANTQEETYAVTTSFQNNIWNDLYANTFNYDIMRQKAKIAGAGFYEGVARMMIAHNFAMLVDVYGNVPYFDALRGSGNITPKYDDAKTIYQNLFRQVDTAISLINATVDAKNVDYRTNDLIYGSYSTTDKATQLLRWNKFGNTLKLRWLIHLYQVPGFDIAGEMAKITANGAGFIGTGESAHLNPGFSASKPNPYYRTYVINEGGTRTSGSQYYKANDYAIEMYKGDGDPRVDYFYTAGSGGQIGVQYGLPPLTDNAESVLASVSGKGLLPSGATSRAWILTSVESKFLQAEARFRNIITTGPIAQQAFTSAVQESFIWLGLTAAQADTYVAGNTVPAHLYSEVDYLAVPPANAGVTTPGLYTILHQKWFALNAIATYEVWADYRRTDIVYGVGGGYAPGPPISVAPGNTATKIPVRLLYPQNEYNYNGVNVGAQGTVSAFTSKIFWDIK